MNQYNPLNKSASLHNSVNTNIHSENDILEGNNSTEFDFKTSVHKIDDHYQHKDEFQQPMGEEPSLDAKAEKEYENQYAVEGQENEGKITKFVMASAHTTYPCRIRRNERNVRSHRR